MCDRYHWCSYIYEGAQNGSTNIVDPVGRAARNARPAREILSLEDYRQAAAAGSARVSLLSEVLHHSLAWHAELGQLNCFGSVLRALTAWCRECPCPPLLASDPCLPSPSRTRHNQYNSDVDTKRMRASAPLIPVW